MSLAETYLTSLSENVTKHNHDSASHSFESPKHIDSKIAEAVAALINNA